MSHLETSQDPSFQAMVRASGLGEVWTHSTDAAKFNQFGWRCTNKETAFTNCTLIGNWNEERFDNNIAKRAKPLPSQVLFQWLLYIVGLTVNIILKCKTHSFSSQTQTTVRLLHISTRNCFTKVPAHDLFTYNKLFTLQNYIYR